MGGDECSGGNRALLTDTSMLTLERLENISQLSFSSSFPFVKPKIHSVILTFFTRCRGVFCFLKLVLSCRSLPLKKKKHSKNKKKHHEIQRFGRPCTETYSVCGLGEQRIKIGGNWIKRIRKITLTY